MAEADFRSRDIQILQDEDLENEEEKAVREYRERMVALLPTHHTEGTNFGAVLGVDAQEDLDAGFDAFMDEEYDEFKIGELDEEDVMATDKVDKKILDEAVDEFIEGTKRRFLDLTKEFGTEKQQNLRAENMATYDRIYESDLKDGVDAEELKRQIKEKKLHNAEVFEAEALLTVHEDIKFA